jgi:Tyrosine-protein kinase ephrin type A/B receptor-like
MQWLIHSILIVVCVFMADLTDGQCSYGEYDAGFYCLACPAGKYQDAATHWSSSCKGCPDGTVAELDGSTKCTYYRNCQPGTYVFSQPSATVDRICWQCGLGKYSSSTNVNSCSDCEAGKFQASNGGSSCSTFNYCQAGQKTTRYGNSIQDYGCEACPSPWTTLAGSETVCTSCVAGKYKDTTVSPVACTTCACTGGGERYISCPAGSTAKQCPYCTGTQTMGFCEAGKQPSYVCDGRGTVDATCVECAAGSHKPNRNQQWCEQCPTGFYKPVPASINNCTACTNRNPTNQNLAFYTAWTASPATNTCPWYV